SAPAGPPGSASVSALGFLGKPSEGRSPVRRTPALVAPVLACLVAASGCSNGNTEPASAPESSSPTSSQQEQGGETEAETDPIPGVEPAQGPAVEMQSVSLRLPAGFETYQHSPRMAGARDAGATTYLDVTDIGITAGWD